MTECRAARIRHGKLAAMNLRRGVTLLGLISLPAFTWILTRGPATVPSPVATLLPRSWKSVQSETRGGTVFEGRIGRSPDASAVYLPAQAERGARLPLVVLVPDRALGAVRTALRLSVVEIADRLSWNGSAPPFVLVIPGSTVTIRDAIRFADDTLPVLPTAHTRVRGAFWRSMLADAVMYAFGSGTYFSAGPTGGSGRSPIG